MIRDGKGNPRLTRSEINTLRKYNAQNGEVLKPIKTDDDHLEAVVNGLPPDLVDDMLQFMETGDSPLVRQGLAERAAQTPANESSAVTPEQTTGPIESVIKS